jgi:hypothetical protein
MEYFRRGNAESYSALVTHIATEEYAQNISVKEALRTRGADAE